MSSAQVRWRHRVVAAVLALVGVLPSGATSHRVGPPVRPLRADRWYVRPSVRSDSNLVLLCEPSCCAPDPRLLANNICGPAAGRGGGGGGDGGGVDDNGDRGTIALDGNGDGGGGDDNDNHAAGCTPAADLGLRASPYGDDVWCDTAACTHNIVVFAKLEVFRNLTAERGPDLPAASDEGEDGTGPANLGAGEEEERWRSGSGSKFALIARHARYLVFMPPASAVHLQGLARTSHSVDGTPLRALGPQRFVGAIGGVDLAHLIHLADHGTQTYGFFRDCDGAESPRCGRWPGAPDSPVAAPPVPACDSDDGVLGDGCRLDFEQTTGYYPVVAATLLPLLHTLRTVAPLAPPPGVAAARTGGGGGGARGEADIEGAFFAAGVAERPVRVLQLGVGGGLIAAMLRRLLPRSRLCIDSVDFDAAVFGAASAGFGYSAGRATVHPSSYASFAPSYDAPLRRRRFLAWDGLRGDAGFGGDDDDADAADADGDDSCKERAVVADAMLYLRAHAAAHLDSLDGGGDASPLYDATVVDCYTEASGYSPPQLMTAAFGRLLAATLSPDHGILAINIFLPHRSRWRRLRAALSPYFDYVCLVDVHNHLVFLANAPGSAKRARAVREVRAAAADGWRGDDAAIAAARAEAEEAAAAAAPGAGQAGGATRLDEQVAAREQLGSLDYARAYQAPLAAFDWVVAWAGRYDAEVTHRLPDREFGDGGEAESGVADVVAAVRRYWRLASERLREAGDAADGWRPLSERTLHAFLDEGVLPELRLRTEGGGVTGRYESEIGWHGCTLLAGVGCGD